MTGRSWYNSNKNILECDILDGLLLSDGNISSRTTQTGRYSQACKYKELLIRIKNKFDSVGITNTVVSKNFKLNGKTFPGFFLCTNTYREFKSVYDRWYKTLYYEDSEGYECFKYIKCVPRDIDLTPDCVGYWYNCDGSISLDTHSSHIKLSTAGFSKEDVLFLSSILNETLNISSRMYKDYQWTTDKIYYQIQIGKKADILTFLDYVKYNYIFCYDYKYPHLNEDTFRRYKRYEGE